MNRYVSLATVLIALTCGFSRGETIVHNNVRYELRAPSAVVMSMIKNITSYGGMAMNLKVWEAPGLDNAFATIRDVGTKSERWIVYGEEFLQKISDNQGTDWARLAVMAHEIGHHVHGHYLLGDDKPEESQRDELEADFYGGWVLGNMNAPLSDGLKMYDELPEPDNPATSSHPVRAKRKDSFTEGWYSAQHTKGNTNPKPDEGNACPVIRLRGPHITSADYTGVLGTKLITISLGWGVDGTVSGSYKLLDAAKDDPYLLRGSCRDDGSIAMDEFSGCIVTARLELARSVSAGIETLNGTLTRTYGATIRLNVQRPLPGYQAPDPGPQPGPKPAPKPPAQWITTVAGFKGSWFVVKSGGVPFTDQISTTSKTLPKDWILGTAKHHRISQVAGDSGTWVFVATKGLRWGKQLIFGPGPFPEREIIANSNAGYRVTSVAGFANTWVVVMTQDTGINQQRVKSPGAWSSEWIGRGYRDGYIVSHVAGDQGTKGSWLVVMDRTESPGQVISDGDGFPSDWIAKYWKLDYRIVGAAGYQNSWRIVMNKNSGITAQSFIPVSPTLPDLFGPR